MNIIELFYAEWCPFSKLFFTEWSKLILLMNQLNIPCISYNEQQNEIIKGENIIGFPTILITIDGVKMEYNGKRNADEIFNFVKKLKNYGNFDNNVQYNEPYNEQHYEPNNEQHYEPNNQPSNDINAHNFYDSNYLMKILAKTVVDLEKIIFLIFMN